MRTQLSAISYQLSAVALLAAPLAAQQRMVRTHAVELTFSAGYFRPTGPAGLSGSVPLTRKAAWEGGVHFGAYAKSGGWGAEVSAGYTPERVSQGGNGSRRTHLTYGTIKGLVGRSPRKPGISYMAGAGLSLHHRQYSIMDPDVGTKNFGGVGSVMVRIPIDDQVGLRLDGEDLIYRADFGSGKKLRNVFVLGVGLGISW
jgi:hypothetical protein